MSDYRLGHKQFQAWRRLGYNLEIASPSIPSSVYAVNAWAPGYRGHYLHLIVEGSEIKVIQLMRAPIKPERKWREVRALQGHKAWAGLPAAWFKGKVLQLLKEVDHDKQRETSRTGQEEQAGPARRGAVGRVSDR